jgi:hypothetical protein
MNCSLFTLVWQLDREQQRLDGPTNLRSFAPTPWQPDRYRCAKLHCVEVSGNFQHDVLGAAAPKA